MSVYIVDLSGWSLVGMAAVLGYYAIVMFHTHVAAYVARGIVHAILGG